MTPAKQQRPKEQSKPLAKKARQFKHPSTRKPKTQNSPTAVTTFDDYERVVELTDESKSRVIALLGLVGEIGDLHSMVKKLLVQSSNPAMRDQLAEEFGDVLWYLTSLCILYRIPLHEVAERNVAKAMAFFSEGALPSFDSTYPEDERFPRQFEVTFREKRVEKGIVVKISVNGVAVGDPLTDNSKIDDGYRFHDVFHLAFAAVLAWSPVTRAMLKTKRKSNPAVDEVEDGARAMIVEEAVSVFLFNKAPEHNWYRDPKSVDIAVIKTVRQLTAGLEVSRCTAKQWRRAILEGYSAFQGLLANCGGSVVVDLDRQSLTYKK